MKKTQIIELMQQIEENKSYLYDCIDTAYIKANIEKYKEMDFEAFKETLRDNYINNHVIIYYSAAIDFLSKEDVSLKESLELANGMGYTLDNLNSELLATILFQQRAIDELGDLEEPEIDIEE